MIGRVKGLSVADAEAAIDAALAYHGRRYDRFFRWDEAAIYCSELPRLAFAKVGLELGLMQPFAALEIDSDAVRDLFAERWRDHPDCADAADAEQCWARVQDQMIVTPASIAADHQVEIIYSTL
jgi:hypothetical protein